MVKNKVKALLFAVVLTLSIVVPVMAMDAQHGSETWRVGPYCEGYAHTKWDKAHVTKIKIGMSSATKSGVTYSQTNQIKGIGHATSGYWPT